MYRFELGSGSFTRLGALRSSLTDEHPSIAEPVELVDRTPPVVKLRCKRAGAGRLRCTIRSNERATARVTLKVSGAKAKKTLRLRPGRNKRFTLRSKVAGRGKLSAVVTDPSGNAARKRARVRVS